MHLEGRRGPTAQAPSHSAVDEALASLDAVFDFVLGVAAVVNWPR